MAREMAESLKGTPNEVSRPIPFSFYLHVPDRQRANKRAMVLKAGVCETKGETSAADVHRCKAPVNSQ